VLRLELANIVGCLQVGFFPQDVPENFQGRRFLQQLSAVTGGTFQVCSESHELF
jgi:hypothetical protein